MHPEAVGRLRNLAGKRMTREGEIHIVAETARTQERNRQAVVEKLRELIIAAVHRPKVRKKSKVSKGAKERRIQEKKKRSEVKSRRRGPIE
jgi:ribosome-associated protein